MTNLSQKMYTEILSQMIILGSCPRNNGPCSLVLMNLELNN